MVLFLARPDMVGHTEGIGEFLRTPGLAADGVAKVREMLPLPD
jgi:hypothetical protein